MTEDPVRKPASQAVIQALAAHSAIGLSFAALIYLLAVSGVVSLFNHELQRWEQPAVPEMTAIDPAAAAWGAAEVLAGEDGRSTHLYVRLPAPDLPRTVVTTDTRAFFLDAEGRIAGAESFPWTQFILDLHYYLHLPKTVGLTVVGFAGAMLLGLTLSGLLAHRRIFRGAFRLRRGAGLLPRVDLHNRLAVWTAPFHVIVALTGAVLGLATVLAFALAERNYAGDTAAVWAPVFGPEHPVDLAPAALADLESPLRQMGERFPGVQPDLLVVHDPATAGQSVTIVGRHPSRLIFGEYYHFDAAGRFEGTGGLADGTASQQVAASVYGAHFGNWGGLPVKLAYAVLGLALAVVVAVGPGIYLARRREQGRGAARLEAVWAGVTWGAPASLAFALLAAVLGVSSGGALTAIFWSTLFGGLVLGGACRDPALVRRAGATLGGAALVAAVLAHGAIHFDAYGPGFTLAVSCALLLAGLGLAAAGRPSRPAPLSLAATTG